MKLSHKGLRMLKLFEGCETKAYKDGGGKWTIGFGHTGLIDGEKFGAGKEISLQKAEQLLLEDVARFEKHVNDYVLQYKLTQNEFDALVCFAYNIGSISQLTAKRTRTKEEIARKMVEYSNMTIGGKLQFIKGLHIRRLQETLLFYGRL